jgi:DNA-binding CsgD family transcriptional regulator/PAS domain-containing protein
MRLYRLMALWKQIRLEQIWEERNRSLVQMISWAIIAAVALLDWWTKPYVSLGFLYLFPIMFVAAFLPRWVVVLLATGCAILAEVFSSLDPSSVRLGFETLALAGCGLFVAELVRNRRLTQEGEARLKALVETSPAAIVTVDEFGFIELANQSAIDLMAPRDGQLAGAPIAAFLPDMHHALRGPKGPLHVNISEDGPQFRTSMQCRGHRGNDESFTADVWFSTYRVGQRMKLAAIVADMAEEPPAAASAFAPMSDREPIALNTPLNNRELGVLRLLVQGLANKEIAARMEVSEGTIKNTLQQLFARTNVRTRAQLVRIAFEQYRDELVPEPVVVSRGLGSDARRMLSAHRYGTRRSSWSGQPA